jgi:hypothetical protein
MFDQKREIMLRRCLPPKSLSHIGSQRKKKELNYAFRVRLVERSADVLSAAMKWGSISFLAYCLYLSVNSLAGQDTFAKIGIGFMVNMTVSKWVAYVFGLGGTAYGWNERRLRRNTVLRLGPSRLEYERRLDPRRSSSGLTLSGDTSPEEM